MSESEQQNPEHQLEYLKELRKKYEAVLADAQKSGDYSEAEKLKEELDQRLTALEQLFPKLEPEFTEDSPDYLINSENDFNEKAFKQLERYFEHGVNNAAIAKNMAYFDSDKAMELRKELIKNSALYAPVLEGLAGVDNKESWQLRDSFSFDKNATDLLVSIAGIDSEEAWDIRYLAKSFEVEQLKSRYLALSLTGLDVIRAWRIRDHLYTLYSDNHEVRASLLQSLAGMDTERAWQMREKLYTHNADLPFVVTSVTGIDNEKAWAYREFFNIKLNGGVYGNNPIIDKSILAGSLAGVYSDRSWQMRRDWLTTKQYYVISDSLAGLDTSRARIFRNYLERKVDGVFFTKYDLINSVNGDFITAIGWRTAKKYQKKEA